MTITELLLYAGLRCIKEDSVYYLYDEYGDELSNLENLNDSGYFDIIEIIDRISGIWLKKINAALRDYGCDVNYRRNFKAMQYWMDVNQGVLGPGVYKFYSDVIDAILNPWTVEDDIANHIPAS